MPRRVHPAAGPGPAIVNIQLPDSASLQRTKEAMAQVEEIAHETPGVAHTVAIAGMSFLLQANASNFASMFVVLDPFDKRQQPRLQRRGHHGPAAAGVRKRVKDAIVSVRTSPIPGLGVAGGFKFMVEDRGGLGSPTCRARPTP